ncbi:hypothetical protein AVEN_269795-1, partial [Araneus ventricosus]
MASAGPRDSACLLRERSGRGYLDSGLRHSSYCSDCPSDEPDSFAPVQ